MEKQTVASDIIPPLAKVNSLQALTRLRSKRGCEWGVFAFSLNRDMIKPDGTLDELHAMIFSLGSFDDQTKAEEHARNIISITGHPGVIAAKYAMPVPLTTKFDPKAVTEVAVDMKGRLIEMESSQYKREREEYERRTKQERDVMKEAEEEIDPNSIEHFKRQCYLAIKNRAAYQMHKREADTAWENYKKREMAVRDHYARHPDHETNWLPYLKEKLTERGEMPLYLGLEAAYKEIRDEILGLIDDDCDGGVCMAQPAPVKEVEVPKSGPVKEVEVPKPDPVKEVEVPKPEPLKEVEVPKPEPVKEVEVPKPEPVKEVEVPKSEPLKEVEVSKSEPVKEVEVPKSEPVKEVEVSKPEPPKEAPKIIPLAEVKKIEIPRPIPKNPVKPAPKASASIPVRPRIPAPSAKIPTPPKISAPKAPEIKASVPKTKVAESEVYVAKSTEDHDDEIISADEALEHTAEIAVKPDPGFIEESDDESTK